MTRRHKALRRKTPLVTVAFVALLLGGCVAGQRLAIEPIPLDNRSLVIWGLHAEDVGDRVVVYGLLSRKGVLFAPRQGHLHIEAQVACSSRLVWSDARWPGLPKRKRGPASFSARLPIEEANAIERITVSYRSRSHEVDS